MHTKPHRRHISNIKTRIICVYSSSLSRNGQILNKMSIAGNCREGSKVM